MLSKLPEKLFKAVHTRCTSLHYGELRYMPLKEFTDALMYCSETAEEFAQSGNGVGLSVNAVSAGGGGVGRPNSNSVGDGGARPRCEKCGKRNHPTQAHFDCSVCGKSHSSKMPCRTSNGSNGARTHGKVAPGKVVNFRGGGFVMCFWNFVQPETAVMTFTTDAATDHSGKCVLDTGGAISVACSERYLFNVQALPSRYRCNYPTTALYCATSTVA